jgi:hypothetical protein
MAESQLAELQNMRRRRKDQRVRARGHGVPAQVSTNGPLVLCGCERRRHRFPEVVQVDEYLPTLVLQQEEERRKLIDDRPLSVVQSDRSSSGETEWR